MKLVKSLLVSTLLVAGISSVASAKCYHFSKADNDVGVCVKGDGFSSRKDAKKICDEKGNASRDLKNY